MIWIGERLRQLLCGLRGHNTVLWFEPQRLSLRCLACSYQTPGWFLGPEILYVSSATDSPLPLPVRTLPGPLMVFDDDRAGVGFAHGSARSEPRGMRLET